MSDVPKLPDVLRPGLSVVFVGTAVGERSAKLGAYYAGQGNAFWPTLHEIGLTPRRLAPAEFALLPTFGIGLTDIAKHRAGVDSTLGAGDFDIRAFRAKIETFAPAIIAFNGKKTAAVFYDCDTCNLPYGQRPERLGVTAVWVLPSTSGGARGYWDVTPWRDLASVAAREGASSSLFIRGSSYKGVR
jgi:TDG/mug DNA glycosylase family protein